MRRIMGLWILLWVLSPTAFAVAQEEGHRGGFGVFAELYSPLFNFRDMYTEGFKLGAAAHFVTSPARIVEVEYYYSKFAGGSPRGTDVSFQGWKGLHKSTGQVRYDL